VSDANVELIRDALQTWRRTGEPAWELTHPDVEVRDHDIMDAGEYRGHEGVARWLVDWGTAWSGFTMDVEEVIEAGESGVVALIRIGVTGRESGISVEREDAVVYEVRDGLIVQVDYYNDRAVALAAAGLPPR
jgi:ketosteroid isomerase-like protein